MGITERIIALVGRTTQEFRAQKPFLNTVADRSNVVAYAGALNKLLTASGHTYVYDSTSNQVADGKLILAATGKGSGRWVIFNDRFLSCDVFGVVGNGTTDDTAALQLAANACNAGYTVVFPRQMTCKITSTVTKAQSTTGLNWQATGGQVTLNYASMTTGSALKIKGGSGTNCVGLLMGFTFLGSVKLDTDGVTVLDGTTAIEIADQNGQHVEGCYFDTNLYGVVFHNESAGGYTELCTIERCNFLKQCRVVLYYRRTGGNDSFHQSGLIGSNYINTQADARGTIIVDDDCLPYNCPLYAQTWVWGNRSFIQNRNTGTKCPYFHGNLSFEHFAGSLTMGSGKPSYYVGGWMGLGDYVSSGTLYQCRGMVSNVNNSFTPYGLRWNAQLKYDKPLTVMPLYGAVYKLYLTVVGANYDYRAELTVDSTGGSAATGEVFINAVMRYADTNVTPYGKPVFSTDAQGRLVLTNANYPQSGAGQLTVYVTLNQLADHYYGNYPAASF